MVGFANDAGERVMGVCLSGWVHVDNVRAYVTRDKPRTLRFHTPKQLLGKSSISQYVTLQLPHKAKLNSTLAYQWLALLSGFVDLDGGYGALDPH